MQVLALIALSLAPAPALAAEASCESVEESEFQALVSKGRAALEGDDLDTYKVVADELLHNSPCFEFVPSPSVWADFLVDLAIARHALGEDWQAPMTTALELEPRIDRRVGTSHPLASWKPDAALDRGPLLARGVDASVDGKPSRYGPPPVGLHLIQWEAGGELQTLWLENREVPDALVNKSPLAERTLAPAADRLLWLSPAIAFGGGLWTQRTEPEDSVYANGDFGGISGALHLSAGTRASVFAARLDAWAGYFQSLDYDVRAGVGVGFGPVSFGAGGALHLLPNKRQGELVTGPAILPDVWLGVASGGRISFDGALTVAALPGEGSGTLDAGVVFPGGPLWFRAGFLSRAAVGSLLQSGTTRRIHLSQPQAFLTFGALFAHAPSGG